MGHVVRMDNIDGLRLLALGRIPRCAGCPRYRRLVDANNRSLEPPLRLPAVPEACTHQICSPLAVRFGGGLSELPLPLREAQG